MSKREKLATLTYWQLCGLRLKNNWTPEQWQRMEQAWRQAQRITVTVSDTPQLDLVEEAMKVFPGSKVVK